MARKNYTIHKIKSNLGSDLKFIALVRPAKNSYNSAINVIRKAENGYVRGSVPNRHATGKKPVKLKGTYLVSTHSNQKKGINSKIIRIK